MNLAKDFGWNRLRHGGLLLDTPRLSQMAERVPEPLPVYFRDQLRRRVDALMDENAGIPEFVAFVLEKICGFSMDTGTWYRGTRMGTQWTRRAVTGEAVRPRQIWQGTHGGLLPVFLDTEKRVGVGRGRKVTSQVLQWLRAGSERLAIITNGRQWRLAFAGLDFDAWCEWDVDLWFEEGELSPQVTALRTLLSPGAWIPTAEKEAAPLLQAVLDSRKGQADLSTELGERVREAVEILVQAHGEALREGCAHVDPADIYRSAVRMVMRIVVVLFAESRELLPRDNALYHNAYGITGLRESLEKIAARSSGRLSRSWNAWPRILGLFRLVFHGSHHPALPVPQYGGELFTPGSADSADGVVQAIAVLESACFHRELMSDREVLRLIEHITRTRVKVRQGRGSTWVPAPVDFSDLSSEYIGILYEGLLDFELKTAPAGDPVVFLSVGNQPALPLSRLKAMDNKALISLLEKMKDTGSGGDETEGPLVESAPDEGDGSGEDAVDNTDDAVNVDVTTEDERHTVRTRAEIWARKAVEVGKLVSKPRGGITPEKRLVHEEKISRKARQLVSRVVLPGEWYLVRWGGTRKGAGTFYTRPGLAVPTVMRTLRPLAYVPPLDKDGTPLNHAPTSHWKPKKPEEILSLKVCDPACGSGSFPVAALRFLTEAVYRSLFSHNRIDDDWKRPLEKLLGLKNPNEDEKLTDTRLPGPPDSENFENRTQSLIKRFVVERCIYGVDLDPLAVELCRLALWIETMDRELPFSFLDHKIKCGNSLVGTWFDQFPHYPAMAWKNREGGDKGHSNGVHYQKEMRTKAIKAFVKDTLTPDLETFLKDTAWFAEDFQKKAAAKHDEALQTLSRLHDLPVNDSARRARMYREEFVGADAYRSLKAAMDLWCACWFWPPDQIEVAPLPTTFAESSAQTRAVAERVATDKGFFHWALEFPDVFRSKGSGFDAVLGNPPWDIAKPNSKEFFSNIDPLYRTYGKQEAVRYQTDYFADERIEHDWLDYNADFRAQSNYMGHVASPWGDPEENDKSQSRFSIKRGKANLGLHDRWREARKKSVGFSDPLHPFRHQGSADINLYKLFLELAHALLRKGGRLGFIVPSGLYSDHGTGALRELFLDRCRWEWLFGFENRDKVFQIDSRFKFNPVIIEKSGRTDAIQTAFMRRKLEDWDQGETLATPYHREQVTQFSPRSRAILEIQSSRDLEILEKIYSNSVLLGNDGPDGWGIKYSTEFHMTNDSKLFPPRPKWEARGYRPDEYSRWLKGEWRPIEALWEDLDVEPMKEGETRCAQPPYNRLPVPRADIPEGIILSREVDGWIRENEIEDTALPLYQGVMIKAFDFSSAEWISGTGLNAKWDKIPWNSKIINPQFLLGAENLKSQIGSDSLRVGFRDIARTTDQRTMIAAPLLGFPAGNKVPLFLSNKGKTILLMAELNSWVFDWTLRNRQGSTSINYYILDEMPLPSCLNDVTTLAIRKTLTSRIGLVASFFADQWIKLSTQLFMIPLKRLWGITKYERLRLQCSVDAVSAVDFGLNFGHLKQIFSQTDYSSETFDDLSKNGLLAPKGFWRVDKDKDPELRHTVLTLIAFHDLEEKIRQCGGDREKGIEAFLNQNDGEGWMLPETLRLADYGLGHDDRAKEHQPVASRLGPRFYDWQLAQSPEESWRECHLHARNLLGRSGYLKLLGEVLGDTPSGGWEDALYLAFDIEEKQHLTEVFSIAIGLMDPEMWRVGLDESRRILNNWGFSWDRTDMIQIIAEAFGRVPKENRTKALSAARGYLGEDGIKMALQKLLAPLPRRSDHPWHKIIREQIGETTYQKVTAGLDMAPPDQVAETQSPYSAKGKMTQMGLFD